MQNHTISPTDIPLLVIDDDTVSRLALVADVDDPIRLADVFDRVESRLGPVTRTVRVR